MTNPLKIVDAREALATAMDHARVSGSGEAWALIAIALHITGSHAVVGASGRHEVRSND